MASSLAMTACHGCERKMKYKQLEHCVTCDGWYCQDCYTEDAEHECISECNEEDKAEESSGNDNTSITDIGSVFTDESDD